MPNISSVNSQPLVSIVVPIYNTECYIKYCLESLLNQTYDNIEYIFINDGSTDESLKILHNTIKPYGSRNIIVINSAINEGSSCARVKGIKSASGEYITFCDSDDWIERNAIELLLNKAIQEKADIVTTPFFINYATEQKILEFKKGEDICDLNNIPLDFLHFSLCNKLFKSDIIKNKEYYPIPHVDCWEDLSIIARVFAENHKIVLLNKPLYHYRKQQEKTLSTSSHDEILRDHLIYADFLDNWFKFHGSCFYHNYDFFIKFLKFTAKIKMLRTYPRQYRRWKNTYPETNKYILKYHNIPFIYRILFQIVNLIIK